MAWVSSSGEAIEPSSTSSPSIFTVGVPRTPSAKLCSSTELT